MALGLCVPAAWLTRALHTVDEWPSWPQTVRKA